MQLTIQANSILVCTRPVDFRKSIDGLIGIVMSELQGDIKNHLFLFHNRSRDKIKLLAWHKNGFILLLKRLEKGRFFIAADDSGKVPVTPQQLGWLLAGLDWIKMSEWGELEYNDYR